MVLEQQLFVLQPADVRRGIDRLEPSGVLADNRYCAGAQRNRARRGEVHIPAWCKFSDDRARLFTM